MTTSAPVASLTPSKRPPRPPRPRAGVIAYRHVVPARLRPRASADLIGFHMAGGSHGTSYSDWNDNSKFIMGLSLFTGGVVAGYFCLIFLGDEIGRRLLRSIPSPLIEDTATKQKQLADRTHALIRVRTKAEMSAMQSFLDALENSMLTINHQVAFMPLLAADIVGGTLRMVTIWAPAIWRQKMGSEGSRLAESKRGVCFWFSWKGHGICTPRCNGKYELIILRGRKTDSAPQILEPRS